MKERCLGLCVAQNYYSKNNLWAPFWFCEQAEEAGLFPASRLGAIPRPPPRSRLKMPRHNRSESISGAMFLAAYIGPSMNPTLHEPELMEVRPYNNRPVRVGDVIFFLPAEADQPVVHRIIRITPTGISTRGDNNTREDSFLLRPKNIIGQVVAAWQGQQRRRIRGGLPGRLISRWLRWRRTLERGVTPMLRPLYQALSHWRVLARLLPARLRPRVVVFHINGWDQFHLLLGKRTVGRCDDRRNQWQIQRPFRLFVDDGLLPKYKDKECLNRQFSTDRGKTINPFPAQGVKHELVLADGCRWEIAGGDEEAASIISQLGCAMQLRVAKGAMEPSRPGNLRRLFVRVDAHTTELNSYVPSARESDGAVTCILSPCAHWGGPRQPG
jgi:hypothetical protein